MLRGLIFDMDGVLADTETLNTKATQAVFMEHCGRAPEAADFLAYVGKGDTKYVLGPAEKLGVEIDPVWAVQRRSEIFMEMLRDGEDIICPGVHALIEAVAARPDWRLCIATSSYRDKADATLEAARIPLEKFHGYINGSMVKNKKPDPEIFLTAARTIGIDPARCIGVEDAPAGIEALRAAGMRSIAVMTSFGEAELKGADIIIPTLERVNLAMLEELAR